MPSGRDEGVSGVRTADQVCSEQAAGRRPGQGCQPARQWPVSGCKQAILRDVGPRVRTILDTLAEEISKDGQVVGGNEFLEVQSDWPTDVFGETPTGQFTMPSLAQSSLFQAP
mmetsp:Transcript_42751/g.120715  ORF Transcript_42751/g.120715 Transcript_42751/m.120715 type:complete len:113 (-) Transcript_42751:161-499(-)